MHILKNENKIEALKKIKRFIITLSVLVLCSVFFNSKDSEAFSWNTNKTYTTKKDQYTFKAYLSEDNKKAWIFEITSDYKNPKKNKKLSIPAQIRGADVYLIQSDKVTNDLKKIGKDDKSNRYNVFGELRYENCYGHVSKKNVREIAEITLPNTLDTVGYRAFEGIKGLKKITIPERTRKINERAFIYCNNLIDFNVSAQNPYIKKDGDSVYYSNDKRLILFILSHDKCDIKYTLSKNVEIITCSAYTIGTNYGNMDIGKNVKTLGVKWSYGFAASQWIFHWKTKKELPKLIRTQYVTIGSSCYLPTHHTINVPLGSYKLYWNIFKKTDSQEHASIKEYSNTSKKSDKNFEYKIDGGKAQIIKYIGSSKKVIIPEKIEGATVIDIDRDAFRTIGKNGGISSQKNITEVTIPDSVRIIRGCLFYGLDTLKKVNLPKKLERIGDSAFDFKDALFAIQNDVIVEEYLGDDIFDVSELSNLNAQKDDYIKITLLKTANWKHWKVVTDECKYNGYSDYNWLVLEE